MIRTLHPHQTVGFAPSAIMLNLEHVLRVHLGTVKGHKNSGEPISQLPAISSNEYQKSVTSLSIES